MKVLVDTCIWSKVLRRKNFDQVVAQRLSDLINDGRVVMIGPVRQEILSGISQQSQFSLLRDQLSAFNDLPLCTEHFVQAAEFSNICRTNGIQGSAIDYLICAVACMGNLHIYTDDKDFQQYSKHLPLNLF